jgi:hypothetical protein
MEQCRGVATHGCCCVQRSGFDARGFSVQGRHVLWGWLQERRKVGSYDYAGCLSVPRLLYVRGESLVQVRPAQRANRAAFAHGGSGLARDLRRALRRAGPWPGHGSRGAAQACCYQRCSVGG